MFKHKGLQLLLGSAAMCGEAYALPPLVKPTITAADIGAAAVDANGFVQGNGYPVANVSRSGVIPALHLTKFIAAATPNVCIAPSDSTGTLAANALVPDDLLWWGIVRQMRDQNPGKSINFLNYAIGGTGWANFLTTQQTGTNYPAFYFNQNLPWYPYVQAANCDVMIMNEGVNDNRGLIANTIRLVLTNIVGWGTASPVWVASTAYNTSTTAPSVIKDSNGRLEVATVSGTSGTVAPTWPTTPAGATITDGTVTWALLNTAVNVPKIPDMLMVTNWSANVLAGAPGSTAPYQAGYLAAASIERTLALSGQNLGITNLPKIGLIDSGRFFQEAVLGRDPVDQYFTQNITTPITGINTFPYYLPQTDGDFDMTWIVPGAGMFAAGTTLQFTIGSADGSGFPTSSLNLTNPGSATQVSLTYYSSGGGVPAILYTNSTIWTTGNNTVEFIGHAEHFMAIVNGVTMIDANLPRTITQEQIGLYQVINPPASFAVTMNAYNSGTMRRYRQMITPNDCWGPQGGPFINGGQGSVHASSRCISLVTNKVLEATRFSAVDP